MVRLGLERLAAEPQRWLSGVDKVGLLYNAASVDAQYRLARDVVHQALGGRLAALFGPQHGIHCDVQDNMVQSDHARDRKLGVPAWSLYAETRKPTPKMLQGLDAVLVDLQDVGTRVYTFIWTLRLLMEACGEAGVKVIVLDRPNPIGGVAVEGNVLEAEVRSFVGLDPMPMRHGMTMGEIARWFVEARGLECELDVVPMEGWERPMSWAHTGRPWVLPSPNMPTPESALVYPGTVLLEGTNASEGRGTTRPFEIIGGVWGEVDELANALAQEPLPGVVFRPLVFQPTFHKWEGRSCRGIQLHVTDPDVFLPYRTGLAILKNLWGLFQDRGFEWRQPPYEYEEHEPPIHLLLGSRQLRRSLEVGVALETLEQQWAPTLAAFEEERKACLIY